MFLDELNANQPFTLKPVDHQPPTITSDDESVVFLDSSIPLYALVTSHVNPSAVEYKNVVAGDDMVFIRLVGNVEVDATTGWHNVSLLNRPVGYYELLEKQTKVYPYIHPVRVAAIDSQVLDAKLVKFKEVLNGIDF